MKNKAAVYFLVLVVIVVWGLIIYRVVDAARSDEDDPGFMAHTVIAKEPLNDYELVKDTATLKLNYRDPFALLPSRENVPVSVSKPAGQLVAPVRHILPELSAKPAVNWSFIRYSGFIRNPHTKKLIALVSIGSKSLMLSEGETAEQVKLLKNMKDSIRIAYQNQTHYIVLNTDSAL